MTMYIVVFLGLIKTFFFLRIFDPLSPIVTMIARVVKDLQVFTFFFMLLIWMFSILIGVLGLGNVNVEGNFRDTFLGENDYPGKEYRYLGTVFGNLLSVFRASMGDFVFIEESNYLNKEENVVFWVTFLLIIGVTNIIFLNFVIAEAGNSYNIVSE